MGDHFTEKMSTGHDKPWERRPHGGHMGFKIKEPGSSQ